MHASCYQQTVVTGAKMIQRAGYYIYTVYAMHDIQALDRKHFELENARTIADTSTSWLPRCQELE